MNQQFYISTYHTASDYTYISDGTNPSTVITKLIQLAGRLCEHYASDIVFEAVAFRKAIESEQVYDKILFFREYGVEAFAPEDIECIDGTDYLQSWRLSFNPLTQMQKLQRVTVRKER